MENNILKHRMAVIENIQKSFNSELGVETFDELEKAKWNVGDTKVYQGVTYEVGGFNAKGAPLWRKANGGASSGKTSSSGSSETSQKTSKTTSEGHTTIGLSSGSETKMLEEANRKNETALKNTPQKLKKRDEKMFSDLESLGREVNKKVIAEIKRTSPGYGGSGDFDGISVGSLYFRHVPKENEFNFTIHTKCYRTKDADDFVKRMSSDIKKIAKNNGFNLIRIEDADGSSGDYKKVKVSFRKVSSDEKQNHIRYGFKEIQS